VTVTVYGQHPVVQIKADSILKQDLFVFQGQPAVSLFCKHNLKREEVLFLNLISICVISEV
jgi:hypothetical protein